MKIVMSQQHNGERRNGIGGSFRIPHSYPTHIFILVSQRDKSLLEASLNKPPVWGGSNQVYGTGH